MSAPLKLQKPRHQNDCVAAVLATLLGYPISEMPNFWNGKGAAEQYERVRRWLFRRGYHWYYSTVSPRQIRALRNEKFSSGESWPPRGYWCGSISRVEWLRDYEPNHLVLMKNQRCVYNPGGKLSETLEDDVWLVGYYLLVPLDPR